MHTTLCIAALVGIAYSAPQSIDLDKIAADPAPVLVKPPVNVVSDTPPDVPAPAVVPLTSVSAKKRGLDMEKRDGDCSPYPAGSGPVPTPDTPAAFQSDPDFAATAQNAPTPDGYAQVFNNLGASLQASNYMGLYTLTSYDTLTCASKCDQADGCQAFNVYFERDPTVNANEQQCPNPPSTTNYRCTLWGAPVCSEEATNSGQYQAEFHVVIAGSNAYNKDAPPPAINGYTGPQELGGAINAPTDSGSYMGYQYFPFSQSQGYDPQTCADACDAQTAYDSRHPAADGSFMSCIFFNAYVLSKNAIPQGLYCSMYNETWGPSYGVNYGQYRGSDRYTVSESYSYTKNSNSGHLPSASSSASSSSKSLSSTSSTLPSSSVTVVSSQTSTSTSGTRSSQSSVATSSSAPMTSSTSGPTSSVPASGTSSAPSTVSTTCAPSPSNNVVQNGGFECGLAPWVPGDVPNSKHSVSSPGDNSNFAYEFDQTGPVDANSNMHPPSVNQDLIVTVGQSYQLTYRTYFDKCDEQEGFVGLMLNHQPVQTTDACDLGAGQFESNSYTFTATVSPFNVRFEFLTAEYPVVIKIDNVAVVPVTSTSALQTTSLSVPQITSTSALQTIYSSALQTTSSSAPQTTSTPITSCGFSSNSLIQNGGFECGLSSWNAYDANNSSHSISSPGDSSTSAYEFDQIGAVQAHLQAADLPNLNQDLYVTVGQSYQLTYRYYLSTCGANTGALAVSLNGKGVLLGVQLVESCDYKTGAFRDFSFTFTATVAPMNLLFQFYAGGNGDVMKIDNVAVVPVASPSNPSPSFTAPVVAPSCTNSVIQNGGFETGNLAPWTVTNRVGQVVAGTASAGSPDAGGNYAFNGYLQLPTSPYAGHVGLALQQTMSTCAGTNYSISVDYQFTQAPFYSTPLTLTLDFAGRQGAVISADTSHTPLQTWQTLTATFQAVSNADWLQISMSATSPASGQIDNVRVAYYPYPAY